MFYKMKHPRLINNLPFTDFFNHEPE